MYNMFKEKENYYFVEEFEKYDINAIYTKKIMGNMSDYCILENQEKEIQKINRDNLLKELGIEEKKEVMAFQTHSSNVHVIDETTDKYYYEKEKNIDGFITKRKDVVIFTFYADCLPIFVYDKKNDVIGVWHSGWQGTYSEIMKNGLEKMKEVYNSSPKDILMALGIGISQENYEVGTEFYEKFEQKFGKESEIVNKSFKFNGKTNKYYFDNNKFNEISALNLGIKKENLIISEENTWDEKFHSHRREGKKSGRAAAVICFNKIK